MQANPKERARAEAGIPKYGYDTEKTKDKFVWVRVAPGRTRRMRKSEAVANGYEIDRRPGRGFGSHGVRREFMTQAERTELFNKTGVQVESRADMRAAYRVKGLREAEKGEAAYEQFDSMNAGVAPPTESLDLWGDEARRKPFNAREAYARNLHKYGKPVTFGVDP